MVSGATAFGNRHHGVFHELARMARAAAHTSKPSSTAEEASDSADANDEADSASVRDAVEALSARDRDVQAHEAAHMAAGGAYIRGGATYTYQTGPDGRRYAIGGEVGIDMSAVPGAPRATIAKMEAIRAAALAPGDPSPQDLSVASAAAQIEAQAQSELSKEMAAGSSSTSDAQTNRGKSARVGLFVNAWA